MKFGLWARYDMSQKFFYWRFSILCPWDPVKKIGFYRLSCTIIVVLEVNIPGQGKSLQVSVLAVSPVHSFPLNCGVGFVQLLKYDWVPAAQVFEHGPSVCHSDHPP